MKTELPRASMSSDIVSGNVSILALRSQGPERIYRGGGSPFFTQVLRGGSLNFVNLGEGLYFSCKDFLQYD